MHRLALIIAAVALALAASASFLLANLTADYVETTTAAKLRERLVAQGYDWVSVRTDGLLVHLAGAAPSEAARFKALAAVKGIVNSARVRDKIKVVDPDSLHPPRFSLEMLRNGDGISLIGLLPGKTARASVLDSIKEVASGARIGDMLEIADYPAPKGWAAALKFGLDSLRMLPRSKISVSPERVTITASTDSQAEKRRIEDALRKARPQGLELRMQINAPRPVISPFSLRVIKDSTGLRFDSCSADTPKAIARIMEAARKAGLTGKADCRIGLGAPSPRWAEAVARAIAALDALGGGDLTFSDADITLVSTADTSQENFDQVVHELETDLPDVFSVHALLPPRPIVEGKTKKTPPPEFVVTLSPEGLARMRGRLRDARTRTAVDNFARAQFGWKNVDDATRIDPALPDGWPKRVMAGLQALARLHNGLLKITPDLVSLRGTADRPQARTEITQILSSSLLGQGRFSIDVKYVPALNHQKARPSPRQCVDRINTILKRKQITFAPSSARIDADSMDVVQKIADTLEGCEDVRMEIGGHTDSQGRESMNLTLSQARAEAVLDALLNLDVLTTNLRAKGYGESQPVADNSTEEGRKANRRIEFRLIGPDGKAIRPAPQPADAAASAQSDKADHAAGDSKPNQAKPATAKPEEKNGTN